MTPQIYFSQRTVLLVSIVEAGKHNNVPVHKSRSEKLLFTHTEVA